MFAGWFTSQNGRWAVGPWTWGILGACALSIIGGEGEAWGTPRALEELRQGRGVLPSLRSVLDAAERTLQGRSSSGRPSYVGNARLRAWLPMVQLRAGTDRDFGVRYDDEVPDRRTQAQNLAVDISLRWELRDALVNDVELRARRLHLSYVALWQRVRERVTRLYFERAVLELVPHAQKDSIDWSKQAASLDYQLFALTGGDYALTRRR